MDKAAAALRWIVDVFERHDVPYQLVGGLAAFAYGATRELRDIDFYIPMNRFPIVRPDVEVYLVSQPKHYRNQLWDLVFAKIDYQGQTIELGDANDTKIWSAREQVWVPQKIDFSASKSVEIFGITVAVMPKAQLLEYKAVLARDIDEIDISQIESAGSDEEG